MGEFMFSPYGVLPGEYKDKGLDDEAVMKHWKPKAPQPERVTSFQKWQRAILEQIAEFIWPVYDPKTDTWHGAAKQTAKCLTELELQSMIQEFIVKHRILESYPAPNLAVPLIENHLAHYRYEDEEVPGFNFRQYDRTLGNREEEIVLYKMLSAVTNSSLGVGEKISGHFWFKSQLQRPRPLNAAMILNLEKDFESELSLRGQHPSIVSGHCLQGIMMCCSVLEYWSTNGPRLDSDRLESLAQYMVDVGDRRVFAGVHYPSDNVASWAAALSLIPEVFDGSNKLYDFVRRAIIDKSLVYKLIEETYWPDKNALGVVKMMSIYGLGPAGA